MDHRRRGVEIPINKMACIKCRGDFLCCFSLVLWRGVAIQVLQILTLLTLLNVVLEEQGVDREKYPLLAFS